MAFRHFIRVAANIYEPDDNVADNNPLQKAKFQRCASTRLNCILQRDIWNPERGREELSAA